VGPVTTARSCLPLGAHSNPEIDQRGRAEVPWQPTVHRPVGWRDKRARDQDYALHRNKRSVALMRSTAWRDARAKFLRVHPVCAGCGAIAMVVDHLDPHCGDPVIFWDRRRWQALCVPCHARKTAAQDGGFGNARR
jgi:5-methylcytosine-specific restriction protein A